MEVEAQEAAATAALAWAEAVKMAARMVVALAVVERVAVGLAVMERAAARRRRSPTPR